MLPLSFYYDTYTYDNMVLILKQDVRRTVVCLIIYF